MCATLLFAGCAYDDDDLWNSIDDIEKQLKTLQETVEGMNSEITTLRSLVDAVNTGKTITAVAESGNGYTITFSDNTSISVMGGTAGADIPVIGIKEDGGVYYWTITKNGATDWLTDTAGNKFAVAGITPKIGVDSEGYWTIDTGSGAVQVTDEAGNPIQAAGKTGEKGETGDSFFQSVTQSDTEVVFTLTDGTKITIPKAATLQLAISGAAKQDFYFGESRQFTMELTGDADITLSKPDGWRVKTDGNTLTITAPDESNPYAETEGEIAVIAIGKVTAVAKISVTASAYQAPYTLTFEDVPANYLAGPTAYGANLYRAYGEGYFESYTDPASGLNFNIPYYLMAGWEGFALGGSAISRWNDMTTEGYLNQCSAYYSDVTTGKGGHNGSETFSLVYAAVGMGPSYPTYIEFENDEEKVIDHMYISNATYAVLSMTYGDGWGKAFSYADQDWFKVTIQGYDAAGNKTGTPVEYYLADFRTADAPGIITGWHKVDLSPVGNANRLIFSMSGSDGSGNNLKTPAYFCIDDIAIRR